MIQVDIFRYFYYLEVLQLGRNFIRQIEVGVFNGLVSFNILELFDNWLIVIFSGVFEYLFKLREFWFRNNFIESIFFYVFNRVFFFMRLDLGEFKKLEYIFEGVFEGLFNFKYLNLGMCNIKDMFNFIFLVGLEELEMLGNYFLEIRFGFFYGLSFFKKLWVMNLQVSLIERNVFDGLVSFVEFNLVYNNFFFLFYDFFILLRYLVELYLYYNFWNCDCDILWLVWWFWEYIFINFICCGRCYVFLYMRGRYLVEVDQVFFQCFVFFIMDVFRDFNIFEGRMAEFKCRIFFMFFVKWLLFNGIVFSYVFRYLRIFVFNDGILNFFYVLFLDIGVYICMVINVVGNFNVSVYFNVSTVEFNIFNYSFFITVIVEIIEISFEDITRKYKFVFITFIGYQSVYIIFITVFIQIIRVFKQVVVFAIDINDKMQISLDEVMKIIKIIIGCFVVVILLVVVMLIVFYKFRKRYQQRSIVIVVRIVEIIQVDEDILAVVFVVAIVVLFGVLGEGVVVLFIIYDYINYNIYKLVYGVYWIENSLGNFLYFIVIIIFEFYIIQIYIKDKVQEI